MAIMRAGVTHWHAGQIESGHGMICQAYRILMVTHGPNHAITRDLEVRYIRVNFHFLPIFFFSKWSNLPLLNPQTMRRQTEIELKMFKQNEDEYHAMREAALKK